METAVLVAPITALEFFLEDYLLKGKPFLPTLRYYCCLSLPFPIQSVSECRPLYNC